MDEFPFGFCCYLHHQFFNRLPYGSDYTNENDITTGGVWSFNGESFGNIYKSISAVVLALH